MMRRLTLQEELVIALCVAAVLKRLQLSDREAIAVIILMVSLFCWWDRTAKDRELR
jgi:hypothetical protein